MAWTDAQASILFTLFYVLFCFCFVFQSKEFSSAGLSPENLLCLMGWLGHRQGEDGSGSEELKFLNYNIRKVWNIRILKHLSFIVRFKKTAINSQISVSFFFCVDGWNNRYSCRFATGISYWIFVFCLHGWPEPSSSCWLWWRLLQGVYHSKLPSLKCEIIYNYESKYFSSILI